MHRLGLVRESPAESAYPNRQTGKHESKKKKSARRLSRRARLLFIVRQIRVFLK